MNFPAEPKDTPELWDLIGRDLLGTRITRILLREGIYTPEVLRRYPFEDIVEMYGIGPDSIARIKERTGIA